ncbi:scavenger receptor cysteine-rich type 1 protein M130-like [Takifugu flavidus]|nr:scavenger receptor cysteine-rich type 1 protein M130-like [Takifugu flavidus]XP_056872006.1 scavenger receptor cysteine-rich type 1 protein M130-like [Takifugu flavidus]
MTLISADHHLYVYLSAGLLILAQLIECDKVRLMGGSRCAGRVEIYHRDSWGTVCDDRWSLANADVVCREVKCGTALEAKKAAFFGEGKDRIWLDDVQCSGQEPSILKCTHKDFGENNCVHAEDAGVVCAEHLRVVNGTNRCNGRVEVYNNGQWKHICNSDWGKEQAQVVCREINCGTPVIQPVYQNLGEASIANGLKSTCTGNETSISQCMFQEFKERCVDATVLCSNSKQIRLKNGTHRCSGRVEIFHDGQWGTVCDDKWGMPEAAVVCRETNCGTPIAVKYKAFFGRGQDQIWLDDVECVGDEKSLADCPHRGLGENDCDHNEDASVICSESVRLYNGTGRCSGRVEVYHDGEWGKICNNHWSHETAEMVCKELNCGAPKSFQEKFNYGDSNRRGVTATCSGSVTSISQCTLQHYGGTCEGVSLSCAGNPPVRLINGTDRCSGRVEIRHNDQWGTVCDDDWDIRDAQVVCRAMDCGSAQTAKSSAYFGQGEGDIWLDDVNCQGNETSLLHCNHANIGENNCGHGEDAGVICSASIRLINGTNQCSGRVEFYYNGQWSPAFNLNWGKNEATVVCREMSCGDPVESSVSFGDAGHQRGYRVSCNGRENSVSNCMLTEYTKSNNDRTEEAAVKCSGNVKLAGGPTRCAGRVEYFEKDQWGTLCSEAWDFNDASVACRQLDCGRAHKITAQNEYGLGNGHTWVDQIECNGMESTLAQCTHRPFRDKTCNTTSVAGVVCTGSLEVRLSDSKDECSGRVEVRHGDVWHTVCDQDWTLSKAQAVCENLQCGTAYEAPGGAHFGQGTGPVVEASNSCFNSSTTLQQCSREGFKSSSCGHDHDAGLLCAAQVRLIGGGSQCSGRVEVLYKGQWGTVCDDEWQLPNADVVCKQLGCGHAVSAPTSAHFGRGTGPIWLDNVECVGQESALTHCPHNNFGDNNCGHGEDAGVICLGGLVKPQITLAPAPEVNWGEKVEITCTIVSEHLGGTFILRRTQDSFKMEKYSENEAATFVFPVVDFSQKGSYFCEYQKKVSSQIIYYPLGNTADLTVKVSLEIPRLSLSSPYAMVMYNPDKISVTEGSSFSVTCTIHSKYTGGLFYLRKSNQNVTEPKPAFGHALFYVATFDFSAIGYKDQGDYHCIFTVNISSLSFTSVPSKSLQITVSAASSSSAIYGGVIGLVLVLLAVGLGFFIWRRRNRVAGIMVQFNSKSEDTVKDDAHERSNATFDGRALNSQAKAPRQDKHTLVDSEDPVESVPEDLAGKVCYEFEPLVLS